MRGPAFRPFAARGRRTVAFILLVFAASAGTSVALSIRATSRSKHSAVVIEVAARQRTLVSSYVQEVLLARAGAPADPEAVEELLSASARVLLDGGEAPSVNGADDGATLPPVRDPAVRAQLVQGRRLVRDLTATGRALLAGTPVTAVPLTAHERVSVADPTMRFRVIAALAGDVSLNSARSIAGGADEKISDLIALQAALGLGGLLVTLLLSWALIAATRRQSAHFRSLLSASNDLVLVFVGGRCHHVSQSVGRVLGREASELLGDRVFGLVHEDDRAVLLATIDHAQTHELVFRMRNHFGEWRLLEAHVSDLRGDRRIRGVVLTSRDVTERVQLEQELTRQAFHDRLTGLPNRALFLDRLEQALSRAERAGEPLAVLILDLDGFKQVNDSLGHDAGDGLLRIVAERLAASARTADTLARFGGDEFALLLEGATESTAAAVAARLLHGLAEPVEIGGRTLTVGASVGIVVQTGPAGNADELIRNADLAMYAAKERGRGRLEIFRKEMAREVGQLLGLEHELRIGLERGEFSVHYQPELALDTSTVMGVEALLRWSSPERGSVSPAQFIPIAEETGLIGPLGDFVLRQACLETASWRRDGLVGDSFVTWVNVSVKQLTAEGMVAVVEDALAEADMPAHCLGLEVTESAIVLDGPAGERARAQLRLLHERGVKIAIDDFGTGFSSLAQLRRFPVDVIKVDRSFVQRVEHDHKDAAITANIVSLAHALGLLAIAEGIESDGQLDSLREIGCDRGQGFLFARPVPPAQLADVLRAYGSDARREAA